MHISRLTNVNFEDKSSREGLQENKIFRIFTNIIEGIINVFEEDRAYIAYEMKSYYSEKHSTRINKEKAEQLVNDILDNNQREQENIAGNDSPEPAKNEVVLAQLNKEKSEEIEQLKDEQKVLRGMASSGIVLASFSHDLGKLNNVLASRIDDLRDIIASRISGVDFASIEDRKNPFVLLERMKQQDVKLKNWLKFSLGAARKDKRQRKMLYFDDYFESYSKDWDQILKARGIKLDINGVARLGMRVFEIDIDSIFNNLLVNSIDAFILSTINRPREISIKCVDNGRSIVLEYHDNGPGLSKDIDNPEKIFEPLYTTKRNKYTGNEEGTGLGMWLVKSIVKDNDGQTQLLYPDVGFGLRLLFPKKFERS